MTHDWGQISVQLHFLGVKIATCALLGFSVWDCIALCTRSTVPHTVSPDIAFSPRLQEISVSSEKAQHERRSYTCDFA